VSVCVLCLCVFVCCVCCVCCVLCVVCACLCLLCIVCVYESLTRNEAHFCVKFSLHTATSHRQDVYFFMWVGFTAVR
jgi:hypothetical protein